jgi:hypothetical protein
MKHTILLLLCCFYCSALIHAQKTTTLTSNLNMSKSNINRMAYDNTILTAAQGETLLMQAEQSGIRDAAQLKQWLAANFKRMGVAAEKIKVFDIYYGRESSSCEDCRKNCKGRCVWEGKEACMCFYTSQPNLRTSENAPPMLIVLLTDPAQEEKVFMKSGGKGVIKSEQ